MPKVKLKKWNSEGKCVRTKVGSQIVELKENRSLFARMAIAAKSRPEINLEQAIGNFELSGVSRSLFASDGSLLPATDKSKLLHILEHLPAEKANDDGTDVTMQQAAEVPNKTLIVDGMVIVHQLAVKQYAIKNCSDLSREFITVLDSKLEIYDCVHLVFDHYNTDGSLKYATRQQRKGLADGGRQ